MSEALQITPELMAGFLDEAPEYLGTLDTQLMAFESKAAGGSLAISDPDDQQRMTEMFRAAHSLKGLSAAMGFDKIRDLTHLMETFFDQLRMGKRNLESHSVEVLFGVFDRLRRLIEELSDPPASPVEIADALEKLNEILGQDSAPKPAPPSPSAPLQISAADPELFGIFVDSTTETLDELNQHLLKLEHDGQSLDLLNEIFRAAHTLKGASGAVGCNELYRLTHDMETVLDQLRSNCLAINEELSAALFAAVDRIRSDVDFLREHMCEPGGGRPVAEYFAKWLTSKAVPTPPPPATEVAVSEFTESGQATLVVKVQFEKEFIEAPIQAYLIHNKLAELGKVLRTVPDIDSLDGTSDLETITYTLESETQPEVVENLIRSYSAKSVLVSSSKPSPKVAVPTPTNPAAISEIPAGLTNPSTAPTSQAASNTGQNAVRAGETIRVDLDRLDELMNLGGELVINSARFHQVKTRFSQVFAGENAGYLVDNLDERIHRLRADVEKLGVVWKSNSPSAKGLTDPTAAKFTGPVSAEANKLFTEIASGTAVLSQEFDKVRALVDHVRDSHAAYRDFGDALHTLTRTSSKIQKSIMATRMVPIGPLFQRFRRVVRDIAKQTGKEVELQLLGENTELDKRMIDELGDPLTHMIRNSVDHGIETPEGRRQAGKSPIATVRLNAYHRGRHICIEVADDGRGINLEAVKKKILEKQLATPAQIAQLSDKALIQYIFKPGFSTAEKVTDLSGRGMGMDIVITKLEVLNGAIEVDSTPGQGTVVTIKLPLTMAIITALIARVHEQTMAIPLEAVSEIITVRPRQIQSINHQPVVRVRDAVTPLATLDPLFNKPQRIEFSDSDERASYTVVILTMQKRRLGLIVEELLGQHDVVIKNIATNYRNVPAIAGASIMGDGSVALILDVAAFMDLTNQGVNSTTRNNASQLQGVGA